MRRSAALLCLAGFLLHAQQTPSLQACLDALAHAAATFAANAPGLMSEETLDQRARPGYFQIAQKKDQVKTLDARLPRGFRTHHVVSSYGFAEMGRSRVLHEIRTVETIDGKVLVDAGEARHAMTTGLLSEDDETKRRMLENLDRNQLEGAVTDFGQLILLFNKRHQSEYEFSLGEGASSGDEPVVVIDYRQTSGAQGLTVFNQTTEQRQQASGQIWLRTRDLTPVRIMFNTDDVLSKKFTIRTEATIDYVSSPVGLVPASVMHKQLLNSDLMMENDLRYGAFHRAAAVTQ